MELVVLSIFSQFCYHTLAGLPGVARTFTTAHAALSNITCSCLLTLTVVRNLVRSNQLNLSRFVIHHQLLPSHSSEMPCRPSKGVPSERLRLVKGFISHRLHTGACVNLVLLTYLLFRPRPLLPAPVGARPTILTPPRPVPTSSNRSTLTISNDP